MRQASIFRWQMCIRDRNKILEQTLTRLRREYNPLEDKIIVLAGEGWHQGVIGIVCSRLCDRYGCPVVLISVDEDGVGTVSYTHLTALWHAAISHLSAD